MAPERDQSPEGLIRDGREHYASKRFRPALESFTRAMKRCSCTRQMKRERCTCKDYDKAAAEGRSIFNEAMYNCNCEVGKTFSKCDSRLHLQALDYRAATFESMHELDRAKRDAAWMLELAPRLPDGYLRLGKVSRLQKKNEFAWKVYSAGIEATDTQDHAIDDPKVKQLYMARQPLHIRYVRHDPIELPLDIVQIIFSQLDLTTLVRCTCVSQAWRKALTSAWNTSSWKQLCFPKSRGNIRPPTTEALIKLLSYSNNQPRHIFIPDAAKFRLSQKKFQAIIGAARRLEHLEIHEPYDALNATSASLPSLKRLTLVHRGPPRGLMVHVAETLESLHISIPSMGWSSEALLSGPPLLKLKYLRLEQPENSTYPFTGIVRHMPNIEQLCLVRGIPAAFMTESGPQMVSPWAGLKVLVALGIGIGNWMQMLSLIHLVCTSRGDSFRHLEITCPHIHVDTRGTTWLDPHHSSSAIPDTILPFNGGIPSNTFKNMECFRVRNLVLDTEGCRRLMRESLAGRKLHSFDIVFDQPPLSESPEGITCKMRLEEFAWLRGTTAIRSIGVFNFRFKKYPRGEEDLPLPAYLASFPNLEILDINSEHYDDAEFSSVITEIIKVTKLKKIYQATVKGTNLDKLRLVAKKANVELIWGERPFVWPVPILNP